MIQIDLTKEEAGILAEVLDVYLSDLSMEIADTDLQDFREQLKKRRRVLEKALEGIRNAS
jgi:hypothetical protein